MDFTHWKEEFFNQFASASGHVSIQDSYKYASVTLIRQAMFGAEERPFYSYETDRALKDLAQFSSVIEGIKQFGGKLVSVGLRGTEIFDEPAGAETEPTKYAFIWEDTGLYIALNSGGFLFWLCSTNRERMNSLIDYCNSCSEAPFSSGNIGILAARPGGGLFVRDLGTAAVEFVPENYAPEVVEAYDRVIEQLNSKTPSGRLVILEGPPGCGKTFMTRNLIGQVKGTKFILIPSHLVSRMGDPGMIEVLMEERTGFGDNSRSITLIVEDADMCVNQRMSDNMSAISSMLNLCDGIMGSLLDVRIIATTNTNMEDVDPAIMRPGRLCEHIYVGELSASQASEVYKRLTGEEFEYTRMTSLATVYADAKALAPKSEDVAAPEVKPRKARPVKRTVGFY